MAEQTQYVIRTQSNFAGLYGLGEVVIPGVTLFRAGNYDLDAEQLEVVIKRNKAFKVQP